MGTKKTAQPVEGFVADVPVEVNEAEVNAAEEITDPWQKNMEIIVPRKPKGEDQQYYICVNDRRFMVPANGKMQSLPQPIAEVLLASIQADYDADEFAEHIPNRSGEQPQMHAI